MGARIWRAARTCCSRAASSPTSLYFYGEDSNHGALRQQGAADSCRATTSTTSTPTRWCTSSRSKGGRLTTPSGMRYRVLALDPHSRQMSLPVLRKIARAGEGRRRCRRRKPTGRPASATTMPSSGALPTKLWGTGTGEHATGRGRCTVDAVARGGPGRAAGAGGLRVHEAEDATRHCCSSTGRCRTATSIS